MSGTNITRKEAQERSAVVNAKSYEIELDLSSRTDTFPSKSTLQFSAREGNSTWVDYIAPKVSSIELNGEQIDLSAHDGFRIRLQGLKSNNTLVVVGE